MKRAKLSEAQLWLVGYLKEGGFSVETEYRFCERMWRFDVAVPQVKEAFEIEGGIWNNGAHVRGKHFQSDMEKYNRAAAEGWKVFRFTPQQILEGEAKSFIEEHLFSGLCRK